MNATLPWYDQFKAEPPDTLKGKLYVAAHRIACKDAAEHEQLCWDVARKAHHNRCCLWEACYLLGHISEPCNCQKCND